jgi:hypothetical protein
LNEIVALRVDVTCRVLLVVQFGVLSGIFHALVGLYVMSEAFDGTAVADGTTPKVAEG